MRTALARLLVVVCCMLMFTCVAAMAAAGPQTSWNVLTLPNPQITPAWRTYAPIACQPSPEACAGDNSVPIPWLIGWKERIPDGNSANALFANA